MCNQSGKCEKYCTTRNEHEKFIQSLKFQITVSFKVNTRILLSFATGIIASFLEQIPLLEP